MTEQSLTVPTNAVVTVNVSMAAGTTIYNSDSASAIWVSSNPGLTPGVGMRIGPKGSLEWTTDNTACYAIADTGVTTPVSITVSDNVSHLVNPVDIGVAVATELLATGVPNVLIGAPLGDGTAPNLLRVSQYAVIDVTFTILTPGYVILSFFADNITGFPPMELRTKTINVTGTGVIEMTIPVSGQYFTITGGGGFTGKNYFIYGSNRTAPAFAINAQTPSANYTPTQAWVVGQSNDLGIFQSNGGMFYCRSVVTGTGKGYFYYIDATSGANVKEFIFDTMQGHTGPTGATENDIVFYLPPGRLTLGYLSEIAATYQVIWTIVNPTV